MAVKLVFQRIKPYEDEQGLFVSVMGKTESDIVLIGAGGETENIPSSTLPTAKAGERIRLSKDFEVLKVTGTNDEAEKKLREVKTRQHNAPKGCNARGALPQRAM